MPLDDQALPLLVPTDRRRSHGVAVLPERDLALSFRFDGAVEIAQAVEIFDLGSLPQLRFSAWARAYVCLQAQDTLGHIAAIHA